jgi:hypothetical protein
MTDEAVLADLRERADALNREAYDLARELPPTEEAASDERRLAEEIDGRLDELMGALEPYSDEELAGILDAWNDARLDVGYVLAGRKGPMSLRLGHWLRSNRIGAEPGTEGPPDDA